MLIRMARFVLAFLMLLVPIMAGAQDTDEEPVAPALNPQLRKTLQAQADAPLPASSDKQDLCIYFHRRGVARMQLGRYPEALQDLRSALANNQPNRLAPDNWGERYRIQSDLASALRYNNELFELVAHWKQVAAEYAQSNPYNVYFAHGHLSSALVALGDFTGAGQAIADANKLIPILSNTRSWATSRASTLGPNASLNAGLLEREGRLQEAERYRRMALDFANEDVTLKNRILPPGHQSLRVAKSNLAWSKGFLSTLMGSRGKYGEAEVYARAAVNDWMDLMGFGTVQVNTALRALGWSKLQQQDFTGALRYYQHSLKALESSNVPAHSTYLATTRASIANVHMIQERWQETLDLHQLRDAGLRSNAEQFKRVGSRSISWALALHKNGRSGEARSMARILLGAYLKSPTQNAYSIALARGVLALSEAAMGNQTAALGAFRQSVETLTSRETDAQTEEGSVWRSFWRRIVLEGYLDLLAQMHAEDRSVAGLDIADEAFRIADMARSSSVQEAISASAVRAQIPDAALSALVRTGQDALNRVDALSKALVRLTSTPDAQRLDKVIADMQAEIERSRKQHAELQIDIRKRFPEYADLLDPRPAGISDVSRSLAPGEALVSIYLGESRAYLWTVTREASRFRVVQVSRKSLEQTVGHLRNALDFNNFSGGTPAFDSRASAGLYETLLAPDQSLWQDARVLNVIPHGALGQFPFAMLVAGAPGATYGETPWLIRRAAIAQLPSANAFMALRRGSESKKVRQSFAGFGDPVFSIDTSPATTRGIRNLAMAKAKDATEDRLESQVKGGRTARTGSSDPSQPSAISLLAALPETADELREIASVLKADPKRDVHTGRAASEKNVKAARLDDRRVVAFATHGIASGEVSGLDQPALAFSNPAITGDKDDDGFLTMDAVLALKLDADWVILSACNTGGADGKSAEALSGLGRAFFYAGARSLLVSNWAVESNSALLLTTEMFRQQAADARISRAEALQRSMLSLMGKSASLDYSHPAFWAPFSLVGDSGIAAPR